MKWKLILLFHLKLATITQESIAGVTYMDDFDFEDRYRSVYECDPFHWHPLHLPEHCAEMYENLIRSGIAKHRPARVVRERETPEPVIYSLNSRLGYPSYEIPTYEYVYSPPNIEIVNTFEKRPLSPYDKMLDLIRKDVERNPSAPAIEMMPNIGLVAVYRQPISKKSENMIKKISGAYAKAGRKNHGGEYYGKIEFVPQAEMEVESTTFGSITSFKKKLSKDP